MSRMMATPAHATAANVIARDGPAGAMVDVDDADDDADEALSPLRIEARAGGLAGAASSSIGGSSRMPCTCGMTIGGCSDFGTSPGSTDEEGCGGAGSVFFAIGRQAGQTKSPLLVE